MEPYAAGWLSILPPIIAIVLALITKEVFSSLLIGIMDGMINSFPDVFLILTQKNRSE